MSAAKASGVSTAFEKQYLTDQPSQMRLSATTEEGTAVTFARSQRVQLEKESREETYVLTVGGGDLSGHPPRNTSRNSIACGLCATHEKSQETQSNRLSGDVQMASQAKSTHNSDFDARRGCDNSKDQPYRAGS